ncbi:MAG: hypothetical protein GYB64_01550, partial [Chloroflexi bacterium]|nr:hypothetical protein [Chloroflexota bacterium]
TSWDHGGDRNQSVTLPETDVTYTANFAALSNYVDNFSFEVAGSGSAPDRWAPASQGGPIDGDRRVCAPDAANGSCFLLIDNDATTAEGFFQNTGLSGQAGDVFFLTFKIGMFDADSGQAGAWVQLFTDGPDQWVECHTDTFGTANWQEVTCVFTADADYTQVRLHFATVNIDGGLTAFDDVFLLRD